MGSTIAITGLMLLSVAILGASSSVFAAAGGPTVALSSTSATTTNATSIPVTVTFSQSVSGFTASGITTTNATVNTFAGSGASYTFNLLPTSAGTVTVMVPADGAFASSTDSSTGNQMSNTLTFVSTMSGGTSTSPVISNVSVNNITASGATINWTTDVAANSQVFYGPTSAYGSSTTLDNTMGTSHSVILSSLSPSSTYHFQVASGVGSSTAVKSSDMSFVTISNASTTPLAFTGADAVKTTAVADNSFTDGWSWLVHFTVPDNENAFRIRFSDWGNASSSFPTGGNVRLSIPGSNASTTDSSKILSGNGYSDWFYLNGDTSSSTPGRQIDLSVEVKVPFGTPTGAYSSSFTAQTYPSTATSTAI